MVGQGLGARASASRSMQHGPEGTACGPARGVVGSCL